MAFRIPYQGVVVEVDSASEVRDFIVLMAEPLPKLLAAARVEVDEASPASSKPRAVGPRKAPPAVFPRVSSRRDDSAEDDQASILGALAGGRAIAPVVIERETGIARWRLLRALKALVASGHIVGAGNRRSRTYARAGKAEGGASMKSSRLGRWHLTMRIGVDDGSCRTCGDGRRRSTARRSVAAGVGGWI